MEITQEKRESINAFKEQLEKVGIATDKKDIFYMKDERAFAFKPSSVANNLQTSFVAVTSVTDEKLAQMKKDGIEPAVTYKDGHGYNACLIKTTLSTDLHSQKFAETLNERYGTSEKLDNHIYFPADLRSVHVSSDIKSYSKSAFESIIAKNDQKYEKKEEQQHEKYNKNEHDFNTAQQDYGKLEEIIEVLDTYKNKDIETLLEQKKDIVQDKTQDKTEQIEQTQDKSEAQSQDKAEDKDKDKEKEQTQDKTAEKVEEKKHVLDKEQNQDQAQVVNASNTNILHQILELLKDIISALKNVVVSQKAATNQDKTVEKQEKSPEQKIQKSLSDKEVAQTIDQIPAAPAHSKDAEHAPEAQPKNTVEEKAKEVEQTKQSELAKEREAKAQAKAKQKTQSPKRKKSQDISL